jgi:hypothetical protein
MRITLEVDANSSESERALINLFSSAAETLRRERVEVSIQRSGRWARGARTFADTVDTFEINLEFNSAISLVGSNLVQAIVSELSRLQEIRRRRESIPPVRFLLDGTPLERGIYNQEYMGTLPAPSYDPYESEWARRRREDAEAQQLVRELREIPEFTFPEDTPPNANSDVFMGRRPEVSMGSSMIEPAPKRRGMEVKSELIKARSDQPPPAPPRSVYKDLGED